jgi:hypothetical protein
MVADVIGADADSDSVVAGLIREIGSIGGRTYGPQTRCTFRSDPVYPNTSWTPDHVHPGHGPPEEQKIQATWTPKRNRIRKP